MAAVGPTLTLPDVADLARVRRPVVSMWRNRPRVRGQFLPFPDPVEVVNGRERFRREDIVAWLERTGRGNNPEARLDAPALSPPADVPLAELVTWLCLAVLTGADLADTTGEHRNTLAHSVDPNDRLLVREIAAANPTANTLRFIDDLLAASYGPTEALDRLEQGPAPRTLGIRGLTVNAVDLIHAIAQACALHLDPDGVPLVHAGPTTHPTLALTNTMLTNTQLVLPGNTPELRDLKRQAAIRGIETLDQAAGPAVHLLSTIGRPTDEVLDLVDNLLLDLGERELAIIIGPARVLCDELTGEHEHLRAQTFRSLSLAIALRLPRGLWREAPQQALGLWVCASAGTQPRPLVADLAAVPQTELDLDDLATDTTAALTATSARAFRYLRPQHLPPILSARTAVVPRGIQAQRLATTDTPRHLDAITAATLVTNTPIEPFDILAEPTTGAILLRKRSLGELADQGKLRVLHGSRITPNNNNPDGSIAIRTATEPHPIAHLDPFDAARQYPRATRTDPGDVIFTNRPRPTARVDHHGGSLVAAPSKILRLNPPTGIGPHALAALINQLPPKPSEWQTWNVPQLNPSEIARLDQALHAAANHETVLQQHLTATHNLITAMINAATAHTVTLTTHTVTLTTRTTP